MRHKLTLATLLSCFITACSQSGSSVGSGVGSGDVNGRDTSQCSPSLSICVGDTLRFLSHQGVKDEVVSEVVPAGELTQAEQNRVKEGGPEVGARWEREFRDASRRTGVRLITPGLFAHVPNEYYGEAFREVYRTQGCTNKVSLCVGHVQTSWTKGSGGYEGHVDISRQEVIGVALLASAESTFLILQKTGNRETRFKAGHLNDALLDKGCVKLARFERPFCVGDTYYHNRRWQGLTSDTYKQTITHISDDKSKPAAILQGSNYQTTKVDDSISEIFMLYGTTDSCVVGSKTFCLPQLAGVPLLFYRGWAPETVEIVGIRLPEIENPHNGDVLVKFSGEQLVPQFAADVRSTYAVGRGCSADGKVCVGKGYYFVAPNEPSAREGECIGIQEDLGKALLRRDNGSNVSYYSVAMSGLKVAN